MGVIPGEDWGCGVPPGDAGALGAGCAGAGFTADGARSIRV